MRNLRPRPKGKGLGKAQYLVEDPPSALWVDGGLPFLDLHPATSGGDYAQKGVRSWLPMTP
jgi:hypothetical protein